MTYSHDALKCAQSTNASLILKAASDLDILYTDATVVFLLVEDGEVFEKSIDQLAAEKKFKKCKIITGFNTNEFTNSLFDYLNPDPSKWLLDFPNFVKFIGMANYFYPSYPQKITEEVINEIIQQYIKTNPKTSVELVNLLVQILTDRFFVCQSSQLATIYSEANFDVYMYEYKYRISSSYFPEEYGYAAHGDELATIFGEPLSNKVA